ncbi:hypothetical protein SDC9_151456 [bioreactor metagenome]|uniref:Uncharacterized protein n=1 Tax=bioreactor metagenome TaxID=1076179 RepID=A0A645ES42_9ZZZZ
MQNRTLPIRNPGPAKTGPGISFFSDIFHLSLSGAKVGTGKVLPQRPVQQGENNDADCKVKQHVAAVIKQGVEPRICHGHSKKLRRHILAPHNGAYDQMGQKPQKAAAEGAIINAEFPAAEQSGAQTQKGVGNEIVADDGGPVDGDAVGEEILHCAEDKADPGTPARAVSDGKENDGNHCAVDGPSVGELIELDVAEDLRQGHQDGGLADDSDAAVLHNSELPF